MSRTRGKREAPGSGGWRRGGDPFAEEAPARASRRSGSRAASGDGQESGRSGLSRGKKAGIIAVSCVALVVLLVALWWGLFVKAPDVSDNDRPGYSHTANPNRKPEEGGEEEDPEGVSGRKEDFFTFLLLGKDTSSGSTDTIILVSYDVANQAVNCMSIPRDTMVNVGWDIKRINSVYSAKESSGGGIEGLKKQVGLLTGVTPDFHVIIEWKAVGKLVDALGGVYFDVPYDMNYDDPYQDLHIHQSKGYRLLDGDDAMQVVRWRKNNSGTNYGDTTRVGVQQAFLKAVAQQCLQLKNWTKVGAFAQIFFENVETSPELSLNNLLWFAQKAMGVNIDNVNFVTMPGEYEGWAWSRTYHNNQSYVFADPEAVVELVNQSFNPYDREITEADLQIMYKNKNGSLGITHGTVLDTAATSAPVKSGGSSKPAPEPEPEPEPGGDQSGDEPALPPESGGAGSGGGTAGPGGTGTPGGGESSGGEDSGGAGNTGGEGDSGGSAPAEPGDTGNPPPVADPEPSDPGAELPEPPPAEPELPPADPGLPPAEGGADDQPPGWL